ncbi:MAG TPA: Vms1/Ankzf1 family peptidyl-tRNA hydrolase [Dehalococcoidia bacterium]|jgi:peptide subunit release factor 1 (eRF1)
MWISAEDEARIARLRRLRDGAPVLSVYIPVEKGQALHHGHLAATIDLLKGLRPRIDAVDVDAFEAESGRVLTFVREGGPMKGQTLAIFASTRRRLWQVLEFQLPLKAIARFNHKPYLPPVDAAQDDNPRTVVALITNEKARVLTMALGEIEGEYKISDSVPGRQRQGGWHASRYELDREHHITAHLANVVNSLGELDRHKHFDRLVLGGTKEVTEAVAAALPPPLRSKYCGTFRAEAFRTDDELAKAAWPIAEAAERAEEVRLARQAHDRASKGLRAALGWDATMRCLREGRVQKLLITKEACGTERGDEAFELAWDTRAPIEVVHGEGAAVLAPDGGVGALLRY